MCWTWLKISSNPVFKTPGRIIITITGITCNNDNNNNNNNNNNDNNNNKTATDIDKRVNIYLVNKYVPTNALKM